MKTLTIFTSLILFVTFSASTFAGGTGSTGEDTADKNAQSAKVARAKAKQRSKMSATGQQKSSYGDTTRVQEGGCANVDIGNVTNESKVNGKVDNEVIITGDVIAISGPGCKQ